MATYKVIQDVEAEDKLIGPLTLRQFVYAAITGASLWLCYYAVSKGAGFMVIFFIPPALVSAFFAFPWSREQSTELWAPARLRFLFKPRKRIWNQSGVKELVTITVPKRVAQVYTDGLSQYEVRSRLQALANTIDSRGWAVKGVQPYGAQNNDRLLQVQEQPLSSDAGFPDILDPASNAVARQFDTMLSSSAQQHRQQIVQSLGKPDDTSQPTASLPKINQDNSSQPARPDYWFMNQSASTIQPKAPAPKVVSPGLSSDPYVQPANISKDEEAELVEALRARNISYGKEYSHLPTILPLAEQEKLAKQKAEAEANMRLALEAERKATVNQQAHNSSASKVTGKRDTAILELVRNDDLNIETIARQAKKASDDDEEVVISLH